jgi:uncharacterized membrane protein YcjF (UPF0283 family)
MTEIQDVTGTAFIVAEYRAHRELALVAVFKESVSDNSGMHKMPQASKEVICSTLAVVCMTLEGSCSSVWWQETRHERAKPRD